MHLPAATHDGVRVPFCIESEGQFVLSYFCDFYFPKQTLLIASFLQLFTLSMSNTTNWFLPTNWYFAFLSLQISGEGWPKQILLGRPALTSNSGKDVLWLNNRCM